MLNIVLYEPEIAENTGNIGRTCVLTGTRLHLIRPFKFVLNDKAIKRSGMDYWDKVDLVIHDSYEEFIEYLGSRRLFLIETFGEKKYTDNVFKDGDFLMFGRESSGIDMEIVEKYKENCLRVPMKLGIDRSLNLANTVNIVIFEALRQIDFPGMG